MEHGNEALFNQIVGQAGPKFIELIQFAGKDKEEINYDLLQSCVWGLGCMAKRLPHGKYPYLQETVSILSMTCKDETTGKDDLDEDQRYDMNSMRDNSISTLMKLVLFQNDGGAILKQEMVQEAFSSLLPLKVDVEEAQDIHEIILT